MSACIQHHLALGTRFVADDPLFFTSVRWRHMVFSCFIFGCERRFVAGKPHSLLALAEKPSANGILSCSVGHKLYLALALTVTKIRPQAHFPSSKSAWLVEAAWYLWSVDLRTLSPLPPCLVSTGFVVACSQCVCWHRMCSWSSLCFWSGARIFQQCGGAFKWASFVKHFAIAPLISCEWKLQCAWWLPAPANYVLHCFCTRNYKKS